MTTLQWRARGADGFEAVGADGLWIVESCGVIVLSFQARFTRGMLVKGRYSTVDGAKHAAQHFENKNVKKNAP